MTVANTVHDKMSNLRHQGADDGQLRHRVRTRVERIYHQNHINGPQKGGTVEFEFKEAYKAQVAHHQTTLGMFNLWRYQTSRNLMNLETVKASPWFEALPKDTQDSLIRRMTRTRGVAQSSTLPVGDTPEIPKSPWTPRPKKDPQAAGPVRMSQQNPRFVKLSMEEKGKTVNIKSDDEEKDPPTSIEEIELEEEIEEDIQPVRATAKLPKYIPSRKGRVKVPKDLDVVTSTLNTSFLPEGVLFQGTAIGRVPTIEFED